MQIGVAETQTGGVGGMFGNRLQGKTRLLEGLVYLGLYPTESARINFAHSLSRAPGAASL